MNLSTFVKKVSEQFVQHAPNILTGIGLTGMFVGTVMAVKATPKALDVIKADSRKNHDGDPYGYTKAEAFKSAWKYYIPAATVELASATCIIYGNAQHNRRNLALAAAYKLTEKTLSDYQDAIVETVGKKKADTIKDTIAKKQIEKNEPSRQVILEKPEGRTLCYDTVSGRYFYSDIETIRRIENNINKRLRTEMYMSLNDFYYELGLDYLSIGYDIGWTVDDGLDIYFSSQLTKESVPCLVLEYQVKPEHKPSYIF